MEEVDIVIIGAGIAGLACASRLHESALHLRVAIVESLNRVGGRTCSVKVGGFTVDEGAGWVHGVEGNPLLEDGLLTPSDLVNCSEGNIWTSGPASSDHTNWHPSAEETAQWKARLVGMAEAEAKGESSDLSTILKEAHNAPWSDADERFLKSMELWFGAPAAELCGVEWSTDARLGDFPGPHAVVKGGTGLVAKRLLETIGGISAVSLCTRAESILEDETGIVVQCRSDTSGASLQRSFRARWAICTLPLGALKRFESKVSPALPQQLREAIGRLRMCNYCKCFLAFKDAAAEHLPTWTWTDHPIFPLAFNYLHVKNIPLVACTSVSHAPAEMSDREVLGEALASLKLQEADVIAFHVTRWHSADGFYGSYSFSPVGCDFTEVDAFHDTMEDRRLLFAGEHTHDEHQGGFHGAYLSGKIAADEVMKRACEDAGEACSDPSRLSATLFENQPMVAG